MIRRTFGGREIVIRKISKKDLGRAKDFSDFINSLVKEDAKVLINKKQSIVDERSWLKSTFEKSKVSKRVNLIAEHNGKIVGSARIESGRWRKSHVGEFGISIRDGYRGIGLGKCLMSEIIKLAKKELGVKIIRLCVYSNNKPAISLYKKLGFKKVAEIPRQIQYKGKLVSELIMLLF